MNTIRIYRATDPSRTYMIDNSSASDAAEIRQLFGTDQIPTPYFGVYPAAKVVAAIRAQNPDCTVIDDTDACTWDFTTAREARYFARSIETHCPTVTAAVTVTSGADSATVYRVSKVGR